MLGTIRRKPTEPTGHWKNMLVEINQESVQQIGVCAGTQTLNKWRRGRKSSEGGSLGPFPCRSDGERWSSFGFAPPRLARLSCGTSSLSRRSLSSPARVSDAANGAMKLQQSSLAAPRMPSPSRRLSGAFTRPPRLAIASAAPEVLQATANLKLPNGAAKVNRLTPRLHGELHHNSRRDEGTSRITTPLVSNGARSVIILGPRGNIK